MSLIFGIIQHDDVTAGEHLLAAMYEPLKNFPQEKYSKVLQHNAAFGKILTYGTPEDIYDQLPLYLSEQNILFTAQGRIDNRDELAKHLNLSQVEKLSDSFFMLQAYLKYGEAVQHHLKGDWSLAVYHFNTKELFIARDTMGYTALYYYQNEHYFAFSSSIKSILALPDFKKELNEEYFVSALTLWKRDESKLDNETIFQHIFHVPNGHVFRYKNKITTTVKYWPPENVKEIHYKNKQDYADEMLEIFTHAVDVRLRSYKPVASMLSGGLDSSTVSYIAADILKKQNKPLTTFSHVPLYKTELLNDPLANKRVLDETPFIEAIAKASGNINPQYLNSENISPLQGMMECMDILDGVIHAAGNAYWLVDIYKTCAGQGFGVLLTGEGGNGSISFSGLDYLMPHSIARLVRHPYQYVKKQLAKPFVLKYLNGVIKKDASLEKYITDGYINPELILKYDILKDIKKNKKEFIRYQKDIIELKNRFINLYSARSLFGAGFGHYYGVELRDPCTDINVMNYFLTLPNEVFFDDELNGRNLVKQMMKNKLPDEVLFADNKGLQSADLVYRVAKCKNEISKEIDWLNKNSLITGYINLEKLTTNFSRLFEQNNFTAFELQHLLKPLHFFLFLQKRY